MRSGHIRIRVNEEITRVLVRKSVIVVRSRTLVLPLLDIKKFERVFRFRVKRFRAAQRNELNGLVEKMSFVSIGLKLAQKHELRRRLF